MTRRTYSGGVVKRTVLSGGVVERTVLSGGVVERTVLSGGVAPEATGPVLWTPAEILADLAVWYDGTVTLDGSGDIATVVDQSGNGNHGVPVGTGAALTPGTWNGFGAVVGGGSEVGIEIPIAEAGARSFHLSIDRIPGASGVILNAGAGASTTYIGAYNPTTSAIVNNGFVTSGLRLNGDAFATNRLSVHDAIAGGGVVGADYSSVPSFSSYKILAYPNASFYFSGQWGDILMLKTAPSTDIRQKIEGYLAWRRGTVAKLPISHPYKDAPPEV